MTGVAVSPTVGRHGFVSFRGCLKSALTVNLLESSLKKVAGAPSWWGARMCAILREAVVDACEYYAHPPPPLPPIM